ncbi:MAG: secretion system protein [Acidimicrobiia bacterium]|nr:MAG: secretion system protein [Acidimicrobiia bacterium]
MTGLVLAQEFVATTAGRLLIVLMGAAAVVSAVFAVSVLAGRRQLRLERRLVGYDVGVATGVETVGSTGPETAIVRRGVEYATRLGARTGLLERLERTLAQGDVPLRAGEVLFYVPALAVIGFLALSLLSGAVAGLITAGAVVLASVVWIERRRSARLRRFEEQLPGMLTLFASSLRAGFSLLQALEAVVAETRDPVRGELNRVFTEVRLGRPIEDALADAASRTGSRDLMWTVMAIRIQREVGGNLAVLLDTVADTMKKRAQLRREVRSLTAEGRLSAVVLSVFPPLMAFVMYAVQPDYIEKLFDDPIGIFAIFVAAGMSIVGWLWLRRIVEIKE